MKFLRTPLVLAAALTLCTPGWSQSTLAQGPSPRATPSAFPVPSPTAISCVAWDAIPYSTLGSFTTEGFLVGYEDPGAGVFAFSASARKWTPVAPAGSTVLGSGDWCLLASDTSGGIVGYSARMNASSTLTLVPGTVPTIVDVSDDVALVIAPNNLGALTAWGYSAVRNTWSPIALGSSIAVADYAISRFVIGVRDGNRYHGFASRTSDWTTFVGPGPGATMAADGNTLLVDFASPGLAPIVSAFSGVRGCWALAPPLAQGTSPSLDHNVAYVEADIGTPSGYSPSAYSAYRASWVSIAPRPFGATTVLSDNVVLLEHPDPSIRLAAFGAGHGTWATLSGAFAAFYVEEDLATAVDLTSRDVLGFSGLCGGFWALEANPTGAAPLPLLGPDHIGGFDTGTSLHIFLPKDNTWAAPLPKAPFDPVIPADEVVEVITLGATFAIDTRNGVWMAGPATPSPPVGTGSVIAHQTPAGVVDLFDERCGMWNPGYPLFGPSSLVAGRNLVVASPPPTGIVGRVEAYSVQRCDWTSPGPIATPLTIGPIAEENVAALVDGGGLLWAYGSANDGHAYFQWPNGTEYHVSGKHADSTCRPTLLGYGTRGTPGNFSYLVLGTSLSCPPIVFPGIKGELWMPLGTASLYATLGFHDPDCMLDYRTALAAPLPFCIQPWMQPLTFDAATFSLCFGCRRADAFWIF